MLQEVLRVSLLIVAILLVRAVCKNHVPKRLIYSLWLVVLLKLCLPGTALSLPILPAEEVAARPAVTEMVPGQTAAQTAPAAAQPAQTVTQPQVAAEPAVPVKLVAKTLTLAQLLKLVWAGGSALLALWMLGAWLVFALHLRKSRRFLGRHGRTRIYSSSMISTPCLAGLVPAVYLTEAAAQTEEAALILRHELTHLRHFDHLWSFCRTAAVIVYWWNPLIWVAAILSKRDAELACDEAVVAKLEADQRLAYARILLAQVPRKASSLSLAGPPVKERIIFLSKTQKNSILCVLLAMLLTLSAAGCSFTKLTRQETGSITLPENPSFAAAEAAQIEENAAAPSSQSGDMTGNLADRQTSWVELPPQAAAWASAWLPHQYDVLDYQAFDVDDTDYVLLLTGSKSPDADAYDISDVDRYTGYQVFALKLEKQSDNCVLYAWNEAQPLEPSLGLLAHTLQTDEFAAVYGFTQGGDTPYDLLVVTFEDGTEDLLPIEAASNYLHVFPGKQEEIQDIAFSDGVTSTAWSSVSSAGLHASVEGGYPQDDSLWARVHRKLDFASWEREMTPEFEEIVRAFQSEDSKMSDRPGDISQWPHYYSEFVAFFEDANVYDLHFLEPYASWTLNLSEDAQTLIVTMKYGSTVLVLSYSLQTRSIEAASTSPA